MTKALRVPDYLGHILKAIERIERYTANMDEATFLNSELVQDAVIRNIEIIGEASNNILRAAPEFAFQHNDVPRAGYLHDAQPRRAWLRQGGLGNCLEDDSGISADAVSTTE